MSLDLSGIANEVVSQLKSRGVDLFDSVNLQPGRFTIEIFQSDAITRVQLAFSAFNTVAVVLPFLTILLFIGGILLFPNRRRGALWAAVALSLGMAVLLLALAIGRTIYLGAIPSSVMPQDVASTFFDTLVRFLRQSARALLAVGIIGLLVCIILGPGSGARRFRGWVARLLGRVGDEASDRGVDFGPVGRWVGHNLTALRIGVGVAGRRVADCLGPALGDGRVRSGAPRVVDPGCLRDRRPRWARLATSGDRHLAAGASPACGEVRHRSVARTCVRIQPRERRSHKPNSEKSPAGTWSPATAKRREPPHGWLGRPSMAPVRHWWERLAETIRRASRPPWARQGVVVGDKRNGEQMGSKTKLGVAVVAVVLALGLSAGCSSNSSTSSTNTSGASSQGSGTPNPQYATWCTSVQNLIDQSSPNDLSDIGDLAAFTQAIQSLASTAPEPIQSQMQTLATASQTKLAAVQQDPTATLPQAMADQATAANQEVTAFVSQNCGLQLPTIDL